MKKYLKVFIYAFLGLIGSGCDGSVTTDTQFNSIPDSGVSMNSISQNDCDFEISTKVENGYSVASDGEETIYQFTKPGEYTLKGSLKGQLLFDASLMDSVKLYFNQVDISSVSQCIMWQSESKKVEIVLNENTTNSIKTTGMESAVESNNNIEISGKGFLRIESTEKHAFDGSNLTISEQPTITVKAKKDGFHGKAVFVNGGVISLDNVDDGFQANTNSKGMKGTFEMTGGEITISNSKSIVKADTSISVTGGKITATSNESSFIGDVTTPTISLTGGNVTIDGVPYQESV